MERQPPFDDDDPRGWIERAGLLFLHHRCFAAAAGAFCRVIRVEPSYSMAWYGLANALFTLAGQKRDVALLQDAASAAKRAVEIDPGNKLAGELLDVIGRRTPLSPDEIASAPTFSAIPAELNARIGFTDSTFTDAMRGLVPEGARMQIVMWLGTLDEPCAKEILLAALDDADRDVRMAALKRLDAKDDEPRVAEKLQQLAFSDNRKENEPYLSMALTRFAEAAADSTHWAARALQAISS